MAFLLSPSFAFFRPRLRGDEGSRRAAFEALRTALLSAPVLGMAVLRTPFRIPCDAFIYAVSASKFFD
jgi:hypothetical protein